MYHYVIGSVRTHKRYDNACYLYSICKLHCAIHINEVLMKKTIYGFDLCWLGEGGLSYPEKLSLKKHCEIVISSL